MIQLYQNKQKLTLRTLFERLDDRKTNIITLNQIKSHLFKDTQSESDKQDDLILIDKDQLQLLLTLMPM